MWSLAEHWRASVILRLIPHSRLPGAGVLGAADADACSGAARRRLGDVAASVAGFEGASGTLPLVGHHVAGPHFTRRQARQARYQTFFSGSRFPAQGICTPPARPSSCAPNLHERETMCHQASDAPVQCGTAALASCDLAARVTNDVENARERRRLSRAPDG